MIRISADDGNVTLMPLSNSDEHVTIRVGPGAEDFKIIGTVVGAIIGGSGTRVAMSEVALIAGPKCHAEVAEVTWSAQRCMSGRRAASKSVRR